MDEVTIRNEMLRVDGLWNVELCSVLFGRLSRVAGSFQQERPGDL